MQDLSFPNANFVYFAKGGALTYQVAQKLEDTKRQPRDLQLIYVGDNDSSSCPDSSKAAAQVFKTIKDHLEDATGPTIVAGLLPRHGDADYCTWAGAVNRELIAKIKEHNSGKPIRKIVWMQHMEELALNSEPKDPGVYSQEKVHGKLQRWDRCRKEYVEDKVHLGPLANALFYFSLRHAIFHALTFLR